ncbi:MAG: IS110 family transposase [Myxococcota bacterium]|jgi:transposase|nr:IS110 family transposase [Myxococcota bacterium]
MESVFEKVSGLDVHKDSVVACVLTPGTKGKRPKKDVRTFDAHLRGLMELRGWLAECGVQAIAMEGTGIYWRPVYAVLEADAAWTLIVGNAQHIKNVPGRKTDVKDAEWLADLVAHGLIRPSYVPPPQLRELRDVTRHRSMWIADRTRDRNRVLKVLQLAGIKLDGVASDAFGKSGMAMLRALSKGEATPGEIANLARGVLRKKIDALEVALESPLSATHRNMLGIALERLDNTEHLLDKYDTLIDEMLAPYAEQMSLLTTIPGVDRIVAAAILAEVGPDMSVFDSDAHLASWAGVCPGNHESAGKRSSGQTTKGNRYLKTMLCQAAQSAARTKKGYLRDKFYRLKARRGHNRAAMAIAHKILVAAYHMLKDGKPYNDLGDAYLDERDKNRVVAGLVSRLRALGVEVVISSTTPAEAQS